MQRLVSLLALQQPIISRHVIDALDAYVSEDADVSADAAVLADVLGRVLELSDAEKRSGDESAAVAKLIEKGYAKLFCADSALGAKRLPGAFHALAAGLASEREELIYTTAESLRALINGCIDDAMIRRGLAEGKTGPSEIERVCVCLEGTLGYQYRGAWDMALLVVAEMYQKLGPASYQLMYKTTQTLSELLAYEGGDAGVDQHMHETAIRRTRLTGCCDVTCSNSEKKGKRISHPCWQSLTIRGTSRTTKMLLSWCFRSSTPKKST